MIYNHQILPSILPFPGLAFILSIFMIVVISMSTYTLKRNRPGCRVKPVNGILILLSCFLDLWWPDSGIPMRNTRLVERNLNSPNMFSRLFCILTAIMFGVRVFQQTVKTSMGTKLCSPRADLFLYLCEAYFIQRLLKKNGKKLARSFRFIFAILMVSFH